MRDLFTITFVVSLVFITGGFLGTFILRFRLEKLKAQNLSDEREKIHDFKNLIHARQNHFNPNKKNTYYWNSDQEIQGILKEIEQGK